MITYKMIQSDYYESYYGPKLVKAIYNNKDITETISVIYGEKRNWLGYIRTYKEIFGSDCYGKNFRFEFKSDKGIDHWYHGFINDEQQYFNPPIVH